MNKDTEGWRIARRLYPVASPDTHVDITQEGLAKALDDAMTDAAIRGMKNLLGLVFCVILVGGLLKLLAWL